MSKNDHTDVRILGALAKVCPDLVGLDAMLRAVKEEWKDDLKVVSARRSYEENSEIRVVHPEEGNPEIPVFV